MILNIADWSRGGSIQSYTGNMTESIITSNSKQYKLYTITSSGTLTVKGKLKNADIWICGGGSAGGRSGGNGGGGGYAANYSCNMNEGTYVITVGAAAGATSIGSILTANGASGKNGGTGGGGRGTGDGIAKYPFSDSTNFKCHCAGGGGGLIGRHQEMGSPTYTSVGTGGSNGGNGGGSGSGTRGGNYGGGDGGSADVGPSQDPRAWSGKNATFYGSGGGGGGYADDLWTGTDSGSGGAGYQGVCYIRVPFTAKSTPPYTYWRLNMTAMKRANTSSTFFSVAELSLYNGSSVISYTGATTTASSSLSGYPVANAFDNNTSTIWHTDGSPTSAWVQVQFPSAVSISAFSITPRSDQNDRLDAFTLQASNDGSTWTTIYTGSNTASGWAQGGTKTFTI